MSSYSSSLEIKTVTQRVKKKPQILMNHSDCKPAAGTFTRSIEVLGKRSELTPNSDDFLCRT